MKTQSFPCLNTPVSFVLNACLPVLVETLLGRSTDTHTLQPFPNRCGNRENCPKSQFVDLCCDSIHIYANLVEFNFGVLLPSILEICHGACNCVRVVRGEQQLRWQHKNSVPTPFFSSAGWIWTGRNDTARCGGSGTIRYIRRRRCGSGFGWRGCNNGAPGSNDL